MTTTEVAKLFGFSAHLVRKWCDQGIIRSWKIPGSRHRRIEEKDLLAFAREHGLPTVEIERRMRK